MRAMCALADETGDAERRARPIVKIYGERNTGTSYLRELLVRNLDIECLPGSLPRRLQRLLPRSERARDLYFRATSHRNLGWKHAAVPTTTLLARTRRDLDRILFVTLTKNPYAWLLSLHRRPYHAARPVGRFVDFLSQPWQTVRRENAPASYPNPIVMWNQKNGGYLALAETATTVHCRYEDLIEDPFRFLENLSSERGVPTRGRPFRNVDDATKRDDRGRSFEDYRDYYMQERWRADLDADCIRRINADLDADVMARLGYARLAD